MRLVFGMLSLLVVLVIVGMLVKMQLGAMAESPKAPLVSEVAATPGIQKLQLQSQQIQQQIKQSAEAAKQREKIVDTQ